MTAFTNGISLAALAHEFGPTDEETDKLELVAARKTPPILWAPDLAAPLPAITYSIDCMRIAPGRPTLLAGYGSSRKTFIGQHLCLALASGTKIFGSYNCASGRAIHVDYEQGRHVSIDRYQRMANGIDIGLDGLRGLGNRLGYLWGQDTAFNAFLDHPGAADNYCRIVDGATFCMIDSLRAAAPSYDENSSQIRAALDVLTAVSERTGCSFLVIDHAGKPPSDTNDKGGKKGPGSRSRKHSPRGSSSKFDAVQGSFVATAEKGEATHISHEKEQVRGRLVPDFWVNIEDMTRGSDTHWGLRVHLVDETSEQSDPLLTLKAEIVKVVATHKISSKSALADMVSGRRESRFRAIAELIGSHEIGQPSPGWPFEIRIGSQGSGT